MPIVSAPRLDEKMSCASLAHQRTGDTGQAGYREEMAAGDRIEDVDRVVRGVRHVDVAARGMDGGVVEAAVALMRRQLDVAGKTQGRSSHCEPPSLRRIPSQKATATMPPPMARPDAVTMARPMTPPPMTETTSQPPMPSTAARLSTPISGQKV